MAKRAFLPVLVLWLSVGPSAMAEAQPGLVVIEASDCSRLTEHLPSDDVHYRPERDAARGIAPADLGSPRQDLLRQELDYLSRNFEFAVWTELREQRRPGRRPGGADGVIAYVEVQDGMPYLNGIPLAGDDRNALARACAAHLAPEGAPGPDQKDR